MIFAPSDRTTTSTAPVQSPVAALVGGGKISEQHLGALREIDGVSIGAVCDLSPAQARFTAERFGVESWYTSHHEMLDACDIDVVHVLTPPATHDRIVRDCLERGCHVIVEKPATLSNSALHELKHVADKHGTHLIENHNYRFNQPIRRIKAIIEAGDIGEVEEVEVRMVLGIRSGGRYADRNLPHPSHRLPAGVIHEFITHLSYLLLHFLRSADDEVGRFDLVRAAWRNVGGGDLFKYDDLDAIIHHGATRGRIRVSCHQWPDCLAVTVRGSDGVANVELFQPSVTIQKRRGVGQHLTPFVNAIGVSRAVRRSGYGSIWRKIRNRNAYEGLQRFLTSTYSALRGQEELPVSFEEMDDASRLVDALLAPENSL